MISAALDEAFGRADELGAAGRYFDAHEELEAFWMKAAGEEKILLQGLIQIAAGLHRLKLDPSKTDGAFYLLDRGVEKLGKTKALLDPGSLAALEDVLRKIRASGRAPAGLTFGLKGANR
jgi:predicted metal-dependent hydrolase